MPKPTLAAFIARIRKEKKMTLREVEQASGGAISQNYVHNLEKGTTENITVGMIKALAKGLGEPPTVLFEHAAGLVSEASSLRDEGLKQFLEDYAALPAKDREEMRPTLELLRRDAHERRSRTVSGREGRER